MANYNQGPWCIQFWDCGMWNEKSNTRDPYKPNCVAVAQQLNKETSHAERVGCFGGHRFRVRRVME